MADWQLAFLSYLFYEYSAGFNQEIQQDILILDNRGRADEFDRIVAFLFDEQAFSIVSLSFAIRSLPPGLFQQQPCHPSV